MWHGMVSGSSKSYVDLPLGLLNQWVPMKSLKKSRAYPFIVVAVSAIITGSS